MPDWYEAVNTAYHAQLVKLGDPIVDIDLSVLDDRHREALRLRFGENLTLKQVGEQLGVTKERVRQMIQEAFKKMY